MRKQTNYKLPEELIAALQEKAAAERITATDLVIEALSDFLGFSPQGEAPRIAPSINEIAERLKEIEERLERLEASKRSGFIYQYQSLSESSDIDIRIDNDAAKVAQLEERLAALARATQQVLLQNQNLGERIAELEVLVKGERGNC